MLALELKTNLFDVALREIEDTFVLSFFHGASVKRNQRIWERERERENERERDDRDERIERERVESEERENKIIVNF